VTETSKIVDVLLPLGRKQHSFLQGYLHCLRTLRKAIICCSQLNTRWLLGRHPEDGLLVIDAFGLWSMYFVVMPRVNLIVILMTYVRYLYSINCSTIIYSPSMLLFILWRDTTSELWTPVQFLYIGITVLFLLALFTFLHTITFYHSIRLTFCLQQTGEIDNLIVNWGKALCCVVCWFHFVASEKPRTTHRGHASSESRSTTIRFISGVHNGSTNCSYASRSHTDIRPFSRVLFVFVFV
jgi:hypothetical protein